MSLYNIILKILPLVNTEFCILKICLTCFCHWISLNFTVRESPEFNSSVYQDGKSGSEFIFLTIWKTEKEITEYPNVYPYVNSLHCILIRAPLGNIFRHNILSWNTVGKCVLKGHTVNYQWNRVSQTVASLFLENNWAISCLDWLSNFSNDTRAKTQKFMCLQLQLGNQCWPWLIVSPEGWGENC